MRSPAAASSFVMACARWLPRRCSAVAREAGELEQMEELAEFGVILAEGYGFARRPAGRGGRGCTRFAPWRRPCGRTPCRARRRNGCRACRSAHARFRRRRCRRWCRLRVSRGPSQRRQSEAKRALTTSDSTRQPAAAPRSWPGGPEFPSRISVFMLSLKMNLTRGTNERNTSCADVQSIARRRVKSQAVGNHVGCGVEESRLLQRECRGRKRPYLSGYSLVFGVFGPTAEAVGLTRRVFAGR